MANKVYTPKVLLKKARYLKKLMGDFINEASAAVRIESTTIAGQMVIAAQEDIVSDHYSYMTDQMVKLVAQINWVLDTTNDQLLYIPTIKKGVWGTFSGIETETNHFTLIATTDTISAKDSDGNLLSGVVNQFLSGDTIRIFGSSESANNMITTVNGMPTATLLKVATSPGLVTEVVASSLKIELLSR